MDTLRAIVALDGTTQDDLTAYLVAACWRLTTGGCRKRKMIDIGSRPAIGQALAKQLLADYRNS